MKLREGNVFTSVCLHLVGGRGSPCDHYPWCIVTWVPLTPPIADMPPDTRHGIYPLPCDWHLVVITGNLFKCVGGWFVRVTLVVACGFLPQNLGGGRDLWITFLLENECNLRGVDNRRRWDTQILLAGKKLDFMHSQMVATQKISPSLVLAPNNSHLV